MRIFKSILATAVLLVSFGISAQSSDVEKAPRGKKTVSTEKSIYIDVPPEKLWSITAINFADIGKWSAGVDKSVGNGEGINGSTCTERICHSNLKGIGETTERFLTYNPDELMFSYQIAEGLPKIVSYAENTWTHRAKGEGTELTMSVNMELKGLFGSLLKRAIRKNMSKLLQENLEELKMYAETGELHPRKIKANEKYQRKSR